MGAFEDGTAWYHVVSVLHRDRYNVAAVEVPLTSLAADVPVTRPASMRSPARWSLSGIRTRAVITPAVM
jgi:hypothetical protein